MRGLLRLSFYGTRGSAMVLFGVFAVLGILAVIMSNTLLMLIFGVLCTTAFVFNALASMRRETAANWDKYAITTPVRRRDMVRSRYVFHMIWILTGLVFFAVFIGASCLLRGHLPFDNGARDLLSIFALGLGIPLLVGAIFYPANYCTGADKSEIIIMVSLIGAVSVTAGVILLINFFYNFKPVSDIQHALGMLCYLGIAIVVFTASYFLAVYLHQKQEY